MAIILRSVKGSPLTVAELDGNFTDLDDRVIAVESVVGDASTGGLRTIDFIEQVGNSLVIHYTDSTTDGPFELSALNFNFRGDWESDTTYVKYDVVTADNALYMVNFGHTSASEFDPAANNGMGDDYYVLLLSLSNVSVPPVVTISDDTLDMSAMGLGGANSYYRCTNASGCAVTIPVDSTLDFPVNTELHFRQCDDGSVTISGETTSAEEVIINPISGFTPETGARGGVLTVKKIGANEWDCWGLLTADSSSV